MQSVTVELHEVESVSASINTMQGSVGAFVLFDLMRRPTFAHLHNMVNRVKEHALHDCQIIIIGNKSDLCAQGVGSNDGSSSEGNSVSFTVGQS